MQTERKKEGWKADKRRGKEKQRGRTVFGGKNKIWGKIFCTVEYFNKNTHIIVGGTSGK